MPSYFPFIPTGPLNEYCQAEVRSFILKVSRNERVQYPGYPCTILKDGIPIKVLGGGYWEMRTTEIYAANDPSYDKPLWVPPVISCIVSYWKLDEEQEIKEALLDIVTKMAADLFYQIRPSLIETFSGVELSTLAINSETRAIAALYPPDPDDPNSVPIARLPISGERVDINSDEWNVFPLRA